MTNESAPEVKLVLCDNEGIGRVSVGLEAFFEFSFWLAEELQDLVAQQQTFARPASTSASRRHRIVR